MNFIKISLKFVLKGPHNNIPSLVQVMAWSRAGDRPLSEAMMVSLPTHICVTRPQWVKVFSLSFLLSLPLSFDTIWTFGTTVMAAWILFRSIFIFLINDALILIPPVTMPVLVFNSSLLPQDKMAAISQTIFSDAFSWIKRACFNLIEISPKFALNGLIDNNPAFV